MSQLTYVDPGRAFPGLIDSAYKDAWSVVNGEATAALPFGRWVRLTAEDTVQALTGATNLLAGLVVLEHDYDREIGLDPTADGPKPGQMLSLLRRGRIFVEVDETVAAGDPCHVRFAGGKVGICRKSKVAGQTLDASGFARFKTAAAANGFAQLDVNMSGLASVGAGVFTSGVLVATGSNQDVAHGFGDVPSNVLVSVYQGHDGAGSAGIEAPLVTEGAHDTANVKVTVTAGASFKVLAFR